MNMKKSKKKLLIGLTSIAATFAMASCGENPVSSSSEQSSESQNSESSSVVTHSDEHIATTWSSNKNYHWHTCSDCDELFNKEAHKFEESTIDATSSSKAKTKYTCTVCGYSYEEEKTSYKVTFQADPAHPNTTFTLYSSITSMAESKDGYIKIGAIFAVEIDDGTTGNSTVTGVKANGIPMTSQTSYLYKYQMPEEDVVITVDYDNPDEQFSLNYTAVSSHPDTYVSFYNGDPMVSGTEISKSKKGETVYVMVSIDDSDVLAGVYFNGTLTTKTNETYGWMLTSFVMPGEDVEITISYQGSASSSHSLTHDSKDMVSFGKSIDDLVNGGSIVSANTGDLIYVMVQNMDDDNPTTGVYYNGVLTTKDEEYGWMLSTFTMPDEDVHVTVTYQNDGKEETYDYTLTYNTDESHPTTKARFGKTLSKAIDESKDSILGANAGEEVYVYIYGQENIVTGVYYNETVAEKYSSSYGWSVTHFTMPAENVVITITYNK